MSSKIKLRILHSGSTIVDGSTIFAPEKMPKFPKLAMLGIMRTDRDKIEIPVTAYLIEHPKGKILIDTGFHKDVRLHPVKNLTLIHYLVNKPLQSRGQAVDEMLAELGIQPENLDYVILTHLHTDHAGGVKQFKHAKKILVNDRELAYAQKNKLEFVASLWEGVPLETFKFDRSDIGPANESYDLFGDGTIQLVFLPGHTPGLTGILIQNNGKCLLLTSDCGYARKSWEQMILPGVMADRENTIKSLKWIQQLSQQKDCIDCLATHEMELDAMILEI